MKFSNDQKEFVALLNSKKVKYVLVGGHAVGFHGHPRYTGDMDFFVDTSEENAALLAGVLREFGLGDLSLATDDLTKPRMVFQIGRPPNRIDILTSISAVKFHDAWTRKIETQVDGLRLWVIDKQLLIRNKLASGRPHHVDDAIKIRRRKKA